MITSQFFYYKTFGLMFLIGFLVGVAISVVLGLTQNLNKNIVAKNITQFLCVMLFGVVFFISINFLNFGEFRVFLFFAYLLGFLLEFKLLNKLIAKTIKFGYNLLINSFKGFAKTKVGAKILK